MVKLSPKVIDTLGEIILNVPFVMIKSNGESYSACITNMDKVIGVRCLEVIHAIASGDVIILCSPDNDILTSIGKSQKQVGEMVSDVPSWENPDKGKMS